MTRSNYPDKSFLHSWSALTILGWKVIVQKEGWPDIYVNGRCAVQENVSHWKPTEDYNHCYQVIKAAMEKGIEGEDIVNAFLEMHNLSIKSHPKAVENLWIPASAEEKLLAVYLAWKKKNEGSGYSAS